MYPKLIIDLDKIRHNTRAAVEAAGDMAIFGVTKGCGGSPAIAQAMLDGGVAGLADSRLPHLTRLRQNFPDTELLALRQPMREEIAAMADLGLTIMISDKDAAVALAQAKDGREQPVMLAIEVGDGREGVLPAEFFDFAGMLGQLPGIELRGIGANIGCRGGLDPTPAAMAIFLRAADDAAAAGIKLDYISAGNSSCWNLMKSGTITAPANQMRFGELILLGVEAAAGRPVRGFHQDAFIVEAEVLESSRKAGDRRLVLAIGCQDIGIGKICPVADGLEVVRTTSDHCVVTAERVMGGWGDAIQFKPSYFAVQALAASTHVEKEYIGYNGVRIS